MRLTLQTFLTLDGVMQAPGGPDEDREGGFAYGGWSFPYADEASGSKIVRWFEHADAILLGRRTYEIFSAFWPNVTDPDDPIAARLNALPKYVASTTLVDPAWAHTSVIEGDVVAEVTELKGRPGRELQVHGSGGLAQTLIAHGLVDEFRLFTSPVVLGGGKKLFPEGCAPGALRLVDAVTTPGGVVIATYLPDGQVRTGSFVDGS